MNLKKAKFFWLSILAIAVFATDIYFYLTKTAGSSAETNASIPKENTSSSKAVANTAATNNASDAAIKEQASTEGLASDYLNKDPEQLDIKIKERAQTLTEPQKTELKQNSIDMALNQDLRFESVYLLSHAEKAEEQLAEIALTPIPSTIKDRMLDFENVLRAQAIEGLEKSKDKNKAAHLLSEITNKSDNVFLIDRSKRAHNFIKNGGDTIEAQDNKLLKATLDE